MHGFPMAYLYAYSKSDAVIRKTLLAFEATVVKTGGTAHALKGRFRMFGLTRGKALLRKAQIGTVNSLLHLEENDKRGSH